MKITKKMLEDALKIAECIDVDYGNKTKEEIKEIDDSLDIIFSIAREKLKELSKAPELLSEKRIKKLDEMISLYDNPFAHNECTVIKMSPEIRTEFLAKAHETFTTAESLGANYPRDFPIRYKGFDVVATDEHGKNYLAIALCGWNSLEQKFTEVKTIEIKED